jgi:adenine-specific DNA-methyltransferase
MNEQLTPTSTATTPVNVEAKKRFEELFPGILQDGVLNAQLLGDLLDVDVAGLKASAEKFGLSWAGKRLAIEALQAPSLATLAPDLENSINFEQAQNVFIEGDNLEVLKLLQNAYNDQIKLIYIDPPYNTGSDFVYNDDFSDPMQHYLEVTGQVDADGNRLVANTETNGRKHSNWLTMMYPRLSLARNLLTQDGSIFVSIDDNEVHHLRLLMDEIFGPENFIGQFIWAAGRKNDAKFVSNSHEYIVCYARNMSTLNQEVGQWRQKKNGLDAIYAQAAKLTKQFGEDFAGATAGLKTWFKNLPESDPSKRNKHYAWIDEKGVYFPDNISWPGGGGPTYPVLHPVTNKTVKTPSRGWIYSEPRMLEQINNGKIHFGEDENSVPCLKRYLSESEFEVPYSVFYTDGRGSTKRLREFLGGDYFDFPKDELVLQNIIEFASDKDAVILDFFAGSGTTAHAVALQNAKDGGNRKYILVTLNEKTSKDSFARKKGIETVSEITLMRLKKVEEAIVGSASTGLKVLRLQDSSFVRQSFILDDEQMLLTESTLKPEQPTEKIAAEILLSSGKRLDLGWEPVSVGTTEALRVGNSLVVTTAGFGVDMLVEAKSKGITEIYLLEDLFAGKDALKANINFESKKLSISVKTF